MRNFFIKFGGLLASLSLMVTVFNVNRICMMYAYQPEMPEKAKDLRNF